MTLAELIENVKRKCNFGSLSVTSDQATKDVLRSINNRRFEFWREYPWEWALEEISFTQAASTIDKTLAATIGDVVMLYVAGQGEIKRTTFKEYATWLLDRSETQVPGEISHYLRNGRTSGNAIKLKFYRTPSEATAIVGWGKTRVSAYAVADIATNTGLEVFPVETHDVLENGVLADIFTIQKDVRAGMHESWWQQGLDKLKETEANQIDRPLRSQPSDYQRHQVRRRGRGTSVT